MIGVALAGGLPPVQPTPAVPAVPAWWAQYRRDAVAMPVEVIVSLASPAELAAAAGDTARIGRLTSSLAEYGPHMPLIVNVDRAGRIVLADGHHRIHAARAAQLQTLPIQVRTVDRIGGWATAVGPVLGPLLQGRS